MTVDGYLSYAGKFYSRRMCRFEFFLINVNNPGNRSRLSAQGF